MGVRQMQMNRRTMKLRERIQSKVVWEARRLDETLWEESPFGPDWRKAPAIERASRLVLLSDFTLDGLIATATGPDLPTRRRRRDAKTFTGSLKDVDLLERCWIFLAYAVARYSQHGAAEETAAGRDEAALAVLGDHFPLSDDESEMLEQGIEAHRMGLHTPPFALTWFAIGILFGDPDAPAKLAVFDDEAYEGGAFECRHYLELAWNHAEARYLECVEHGRDEGIAG